jgi:phosphoglycolate phosphatase-like HAD superfamily hydrolase
MELKHKECFIPNLIRSYALQSASKYARETAEFVNLYSRSRGVNRFPGLVLTMDLLAGRPEVARRGVLLRDMDPLRRFVASGRPLGNPALKAEAEKTKDPELALALAWSEAVNNDIAAMVHGVGPFPGVRECLGRFQEFADLACVSSTPGAALAAEWQEHDLARHVRMIIGQETASKKEALQAAARAGYQPRRILMVGDAPGDLQAAHAVGALFFPIVPGEEEESWERLRREGIDRFADDAFAGAYEEGLIADFMDRLPETPPWRA